jgi:RNA polymerase sigma-70 factor, ECF subfamily
VENRIDTNLTTLLSDAGGRRGIAEATDTVERVMVMRIANHDHLAMSRFARLYDPRLTRFLRRLTRRQELVEEIINDTMFIVWRGASRFRFESRVSSWVFGIAYRRAMCTFRSERRLCVGDPQSVAAADLQSGDAQEQFETAEWLGRALLKLTFEQRTALELMYHAGYSCEEVGEIMGCPASTVKTRMYYARRKLRLALPVAAGLTTEAVSACTTEVGRPVRTRSRYPQLCTIREDRRFPPDAQLASTHVTS